MYDNPLLGPVVLVAVAKLPGFFLLLLFQKGHLTNEGVLPGGKSKESRSAHDT